MSTATVPKHQWTLLRKVARGHKFYRDEVSGKMAVADYSGRFPHETDDGTLWLKLERPIQIGQFALVLVEDDRQIEHAVAMRPSDIAWLVAEHGFKLKIGDIVFDCTPQT